MKKKQKQKPKSLILTGALLDAAEKGDLDGLKELLKRGVDIRAVDVDDSSTLMHVASGFGHRHVVEYLLAEGSNIEANDSELQTPLHLASMYGHAEVVQFLVDNSADLYAKDYRDDMAIHLAAQCGYTHIMDIFLNKGQSVEEADGYDMTLLHMTTKKGDLDVVKYLVKRGANVETGKPMHLAAENGLPHIVEFFLNEGTHVDDKDFNDCTSLHLASHEGQLDMVQFLLEEGADIHAQCTRKKYPIHYAAQSRCKDVVELLINHGSHIDVIDVRGSTPLHLAAKVGCLEVVEFLVDQSTNGGPPHRTKFNIDTQNTKGHTVLQLACKNGRHEVITYLLNAGARFDIKDNDGRNASFHYTESLGFFFSAEDHVSVPEIFKKIYNDAIVMDDKEKQTVAHIVCSKFAPNVQIMKLILVHQKNLNVENIYGKTPLNCLTDEKHFGSSHQHKELIRFLVNRGAYLEAIDCRRISNSYLKMELLTDAKFCAQSIVNIFNNKESPMFRNLVTHLVPLEHVEVNESQIKTIEHAVEEVIRDKGHCDISNMAFLTMLYIVSMSGQKLCNMCAGLFSSVLVDFAT